MPLYPVQPPAIDSILTRTIDNIALQASSFAAAYKNQNDELNALPVGEYLAFLNADVPQTQQRLAVREASAQLINPQLDAIVSERPEMAGQLRHRIPTGIGREGISFDPEAGESGEYIYTAPSEPEE